MARRRTVAPLAMCRALSAQLVRRLGHWARRFVYEEQVRFRVQFPSQIELGAHLAVGEHVSTRGSEIPSYLGAY